MKFKPTDREARERISLEIEDVGPKLSLSLTSSHALNIKFPTSLSEKKKKKEFYGSMVLTWGSE